VNVQSSAVHSWILLNLLINVLDFFIFLISKKFSRTTPSRTEISCFHGYLEYSAFSKVNHWSFFTSTTRFNCSEQYYQLLLMYLDNPTFLLVLILSLVAFRKVRMRISTSHQRRTIHNVFGIIRGEIEPGLYFQRIVRNLLIIKHKSGIIIINVCVCVRAFSSPCFHA